MIGANGGQTPAARMQLSEFSPAPCRGCGCEIVRVEYWGRLMVHRIAVGQGICIQEERWICSRCGERLDWAGYPVGPDLKRKIVERSDP